MRVELLPGRELDDDLAARWRALQSTNPGLGSPYFCPEFTRAVARVRDDVFVGVLEAGPGAVGFFPFQRGALGVACPVGGLLSDYQGVIARPGFDFDATELLRGCGITLFDFDHLLAEQAPFAAWHSRRDTSPTLDLTGGWDAYRERRRALGFSRITQTLRKRRKLEREIGPLRFESHVCDADVLARVVDWKREQCRRTDVFDFFSLDWTVPLLHEIAAQRSENFAGTLSVLYVGDTVAAAHFGMRSSRVWHWWFPGYDHALGRYSPGSILLLEVAEAAAALELETLDLGKGDDAYKASFQTGSVPLAEGSVRLPSLASSLRAMRESGEAFLRRSPIAAPLRVPARAIVRGLRNVSKVRAA